MGKGACQYFLKVQKLAAIVEASEEKQERWQDFLESGTSEKPLSTDHDLQIQATLLAWDLVAGFGFSGVLVVNTLLLALDRPQCAHSAWLYNWPPWESSQTTVKLVLGALQSPNLESREHDWK